MPRFRTILPTATALLDEATDPPESMRSRLRRGELTRDDAAAVGTHLADLHRTAARASVDYHGLIDRNFEVLLPLADGLVLPLDWLALQRFSTAFLLSWAAVLEARAAAGGVIESPFPFRPESILVELGKVSLAPRPAAALQRVVDVADDLGGLLMELEMLTGEREVGDALLVGYHDADGGTQPRALLAFFGAFRAQERAKEALLNSATGLAPRTGDRIPALAWLALSRRLTWTARGPQALRITGPPNTGKTELAQALERASGAPLASPETRPAPEALRDHPAGSALVVEWPSSGGADSAPPQRLLIDSLASMDLQVDAIGSWLDSLLAADRMA